MLNVFWLAVGVEIARNSESDEKMKEKFSRIMKR